MLDSASSDSTLPTLKHLNPQLGPASCLYCTIVFHPELERIGQRAAIDESSGNWVLGRNWPLFAEPGAEEARPLEDPYISRRALLGSFAPDKVLLRRPREASRCRLAGLDLQDEVILDEKTLERGVAVILSHSVVLMLRRCEADPAGFAEDAQSSLTGASPAMQALRKQVSRAAASDQDVLILGETGVGKELVAQAICAGSARAANGLLTVNMAAIPAALATAMLFGNTRGAFSGADRARPGYFREADRGTLFLDEIGDTPKEVQPLLLRALQQREIQVVGGGVETVDVRVLSATDAQLDDADCDFKAALRHRLGAMEIHVPPLRDHPEDIGGLLLQALRRACRQEGRLDLLPHVQPDPLEQARWATLFYYFACYAWPGNVRELENLALQVVLASDVSPVIPAAILTAFDQVIPKSSSGQRSVDQTRKMKDVSQREFDEAMKSHRYEVKPVAGALGVTRQSVYRRMDRSPDYRRASEVPQDELQAALHDSGGDLGRSAAELRVSESALRARLQATGSYRGC